MKKVLFICGSLRRDGFNMQLLRLASERLPASCSCSFLSYGDLPLLDQIRQKTAEMSAHLTEETRGRAEAVAATARLNRRSAEKIVIRGLDAKCR